MTRVFLTTAMIIGFSVCINAQEFKMGYTNVDYILAFMPEAQTVQTELTSFETQLQNDLRSKYQTFQEKAESYQSGSAMMTNEARAAAERELQSLQSEIQQFEATSQNRLQSKQLELLQPLYERIQQVIDEVANEEGYIAIFSSENLLFADNSTLVEVSDLVFEKLGITPPVTE